MHFNRIMKAGIFLSSALSFALMGQAAPVEAFFSRTHASGACAKTSQESGTLVVSNVFFDGVVNSSTSAPLNVACTVPETDVQQHKDVTTINVHVFDGNNNGTNSQVTATACTTSWTQNNPAGHCGNSDSSSTTAAPGFDTLNPGRTAWTDYPNDFAFIAVTLPAMDGAVASRVIGYSVSG